LVSAFLADSVGDGITGAPIGMDTMLCITTALFIPIVHHFLTATTSTVLGALGWPVAFAELARLPIMAPRSNAARRLTSGPVHVPVCSVVSIMAASRITTLSAVRVVSEVASMVGAMAAGGSTAAASVVAAEVSTEEAAALTAAEVADSSVP